MRFVRMARILKHHHHHHQHQRTMPRRTVTVLATVIVAALCGVTFSQAWQTTTSSGFSLTPDTKESNIVSAQQQHSVHAKPTPISTIHSLLLEDESNTISNTTSGADAAAVDYTNHSLIKIPIRNVDRLFEELKNNSHEHHEILWHEGSSTNTSHAVIRLGPLATQRIKRDLSHNNGVFLTKNLQSWLDAEHSNGGRRVRRQKMPRTIEEMMAEVEYEEDDIGTVPRESLASEKMEVHTSKLVPGYILNRYQPLAKINKFLDDLEASSPGVTVFTIGHSHEKRPIRAIEVLNAPSDPRFVWIDACTHAREWVTVTTALYMTEQIILSKIPLNFIIVPVLNVDGYVYTWTTDRMWRKNRRPYEASSLARHQMPDRCNGVDLNRNYDINFGGEGSSGNPCSFLYQGPNAFSEPEVRAAAQLLSKNRNRISMTLSLHSFNQLWASPNAYTTARTKDHNHHMRVLKNVQSAVEAVNGVKYDVGPLGAALYTGSGFMIDWIYHKLGIRDAYLVELRDKGFHGFVLPSDQIWPTATESWAGLRAAISSIFNIR